MSNVVFFLSIFYRDFLRKDTFWHLSKWFSCSEVVLFSGGSSLQFICLMEMCKRAFLPVIFILNYLYWRRLSTGHLWVRIWFEALFCCLVIKWVS